MSSYRTFSFSSSVLFEASDQIFYSTPVEVFSALHQLNTPEFLFESKSVAPIYGRLSLIGIDPVLKITGKENCFEIKGLNERGGFYLDLVEDKDLALCDEVDRGHQGIRGSIERDTECLEESRRSQRKNVAQILRILLKKFKVSESAFLGLYGAFAYDAVRLFEDLPERLPNTPIPDFTFFIFDTFVLFDHLKQKAEVIVYRESLEAAERDLRSLSERIHTRNVDANFSFSVQNPQFSSSQSEYEALVEVARGYAQRGDLFEVVFSNILKADFEGDPFGLYLTYSQVNPAPYLFYFDFGGEQLVGASPEMMVRVEQNRVHLRPISGTALRGADPIEDHENMMQLLMDPKEKAELDMLIDLGRNDLARVCKPGIQISDYRFVEKYARVMHTVTHLTGELREGCCALDALFAAANAGTLTGAPKVAAMATIEEHESERRGYYGGMVGYLTFSGNADTALIIRTAHLRGGQLKFQVGATLLYDSVPEREFQETFNKASAFLSILSPTKS